MQVVRLSLFFPSPELFTASNSFTNCGMVCLCKVSFSLLQLAIVCGKVPMPPKANQNSII